MPRRPALVLLVALAALLALLVLRPRPPAEPAIPDRMSGDVDVVIDELPPSDLPDRARAFLATDRPWRAARTLDRFLAAPDTPPDDVRVLAARAHGGWGNWPRVLELLDGVPALESHEGGVGVYLLARALDARGSDAAAADAYRAFLTFSPPAGELAPEREVARLRLALALIRGGERAAGDRELAALRLADSPWLRILQADALTAVGDTAEVRRIVAEFDSGMLGLRGWRARVEAARRAGDVPLARAEANRARAWASTDETRSEFLLHAARMALLMGDEAAARDALRSVIDRNPGRAHSRAAAALLRQGTMGPADHLAVARVLVAQGLHQEALDGFRAWLDAGIGITAERADVRLEYATALFYAAEYAAAVRALEPLADQTAARLLMARAEEHRGRVDDAVAIYLALARASAGAARANALYLAATARHDHGELDAARELFRAVVEGHPGSTRMGLAAMRLAGMAFHDGEFGEAARIWDDFRIRYPRSDRALQATYWSGRAREEAGDSSGAATLYHTIRERERDSYYALLASQRLGVPFWPLPMRDSPPANVAAERRVAGWTRELDLLRNAGFDDAASALAGDLVGGVGADRPTRYALAEALADRGYSQRAIQLGLGLLGAGPPNLRLLRILHPFPYRTLITQEARDRDMDPFVTAALIRQESMFEVRITSPAGARGLMQIMPATGRELAAAVELDAWDDELLYHPEINVHLGTRYVAQQLDAYDGSLPSVFSAYNAGPHRVERWSGFAEYGDDELFTERIPFQETRNYVKILTRNMAIYRGLYADGEGTGEGS